MVKPTQEALEHHIFCLKTALKARNDDATLYQKQIEKVFEDVKVIEYMLDLLGVEDRTLPDEDIIGEKECGGF